MKSPYQWLVVRKDDKSMALEHVTKVADGCHYRKELSVECAVIGLGLVQLCRKESQGPSGLPWPPLLDGGTHVGSRGVRHERNLCPSGWMYQDC